jgi:hypothetical protein
MAGAMPHFEADLEESRRIGSTQSEVAVLFYLAMTGAEAMVRESDFSLRLQVFAHEHAPESFVQASIDLHIAETRVA